MQQSMYYCDAWVLDQGGWLEVG